MNFCSTSPRWIAILGISCLVFIFASITPATMAQQPTAPLASATTSVSTADLPPLPLSPIEKAQKDGTALQLSLKDITKLALQNNLDIAIQDTQEQVSQQRIRQTYGDYDPKLTGTKPERGPYVVEFAHACTGLWRVIPLGLNIYADVTLNGGHAEVEFHPRY